MIDAASPQLKRRLYPMDWTVIGYSLLMVCLIFIFGRPLVEYYDELTFYTFTMGMAVLIVYYLRDDRSRIEAFVRLLYPAILFTFFYRTTGGLMFLVFDRFYDFQLTGFEASILGAHPTLFIDRSWLNPWISELLSMCYFFYYPMIPVFLLVLFFKRKDEIIKSSVTAMSLTFFTGYMLFFLYPIEGPRWHFTSQYLHPVTGYIFRPAVDFVIANGAVRGGCMPSTHFAIALVILMYCYKYFKSVARWLLPVVVGLGLGTVWGRFHYISDVIVGGIIAVVCTLLVMQYHDRWTGTGRNHVS
jgi:membrane-associated phospholipid phosphatase